MNSARGSGMEPVLQRIRLGSGTTPGVGCVGASPIGSDGSDQPDRPRLQVGSRCLHAYILRFGTSAARNSPKCHDIPLAQTAALLNLRTSAEHAPAVRRAQKPESPTSIEPQNKAALPAVRRCVPPTHMARGGLFPRHGPVVAGIGERRTANGA